MAGGGGSRKTKVVARAAFTCMVLGAITLAFVAYQLWGTAFYEHHAQDRLRSQFTAQVASSKGGAATKSSTGVPTTTAPSGDSPTVGTNGSTATTAPTAAPPQGTAIGLLSIPRLGIHDEAIVEGVGEAQLEEGPGHYPGTSLPGQQGNAAIAGHRTTYGAPFYALDSLQPGDPIYVQVADGTFQYDVIGTSVVSPSDTAVLDASTVPTLTLTTCNPRYSATSRLVVTARLQGTETPSPTSAASSTGQSANHGTKQATAAVSENSVSSAVQAGNVRGAVLWAELTLLAFFVVRLFWRLIANRVRWVVVSAGSAGILVALFVCFEHVSLALPASF